MKRMERIALIGHRGVGKTSLLKRLQTYFVEKKVRVYDLDAEIRSRTGRELHDIFATDGEAAFREIERATFADLARAGVGTTIVSLGAGFDPAQIPSTWHVLWVRRTTDASGRIFTDRPRLNSEVSALDEYRERYERRQKAYSLRADETLWLDEGAEATPDPQERAFFQNELRELGGALTLLPENFHEGFRDWAQRRIAWGIRWFELRDDLLSVTQIQQALEIFPHQQILMSHRDQARIPETAEIIRQHKLAFDWPLELGEQSPKKTTPRFLSLHARGDSLTAALARLPKTGVICKVAVQIYNFEELLEGERWQAERPQERAFLPSSADGRWAWYRNLTAYRQPLSFIREGDGSGVDQPTLLQWARRPQSATKFAAVLGDPVQQSRTPIEHREFFAQFSAPVFAIRVKLEEMQAGALEVLQEMGLCWAAVTAPLKGLALVACREFDEASRQLEATNTICLQDDHWRGFNTDLEGLLEALKSAGPLGHVAAWGGGGTLGVMQAALPQAEFFSLRTGRNRVDGRQDLFSPNTVVWAVGRSQADVNEPPADWKPSLVIDLNYAEDSPGRAFALRCGSRYISGLTMFRAQAAAQRRHWSELNSQPAPGTVSETFQLGVKK